MRCVRCSKDYPFDKVRYLPNGTGFACMACLGIVQHEREQLNRIEERVFTYQCVDCRYQFKRSIANAPRSCPQCGSRRMIKASAERLNSNDLLKSSDDPRLAALDDLPRTRVR